MDCTNKDDVLNIVYGDVTLGVHGKEFSYIFSYQHGGLESFVMDGIEWLYRTPRPTFWRATTDNDRGNRFSTRSGMWLSADMFMTCKKIEIFIDGELITLPKAPVNNHFTGNETARLVEIAFTYETITVPSTTVDVAYTIKNNGEMDVTVYYHGMKGLPELPVFGMRFIMPTKAIGYQYEGLSGETYPDRMAGGIPGVYQIEGLPVTKYLVPQDCNVHMNTKWLEVYRNTVKDNSYKGTETFGLRFTSIKKEFAFSCIPYTSEELENATHHEELPVARRTVVSILGAVRGVGGINSWGADVEPEFRIDAENDISYSFKISKA